MRALLILLISLLLIVACGGSDFSTVPGTNASPTFVAPSSSTSEVVALGIGGTSSSTIVIASTDLAGAPSVAGASAAAGAQNSLGGSNAAGGAVTTTTTPIVALSSTARVLYWSASPAGTSSSIETGIELVNISKVDWDLSEFRLRYWFTAELQGGASLVPQMGNGLTTQQVSVGTVNPARRGADHYVEIAFSKGWIIAGASERLTFMAHQSAWGVFDQSDDYSYPSATLSKGAELGTVGVYRNGLLVAGVEP